MMRYLIAAGFALVGGYAAAGPATAAEPGDALAQVQWEEQYRTNERTYFREHRLKAYQRSREGLKQGANCVTPKGVCWIAAPLSQGTSCSCETRQFGTIEGLIGG